VFGIDRKSALEIRVHRHLHSGRNDTQMLKHLIQRDLIVRAAQRPCETRARRRQRLEPDRFERPRTPHIPRVGHREATGGVQAAERNRAIVVWFHAITSSTSRPQSSRWRYGVRSRQLGASSQELWLEAVERMTRRQEVTVQLSRINYRAVGIRQHDLILAVSLPGLFAGARVGVSSAKTGPWRNRSPRRRGSASADW
jgi:hypothetical protein